MGGGRSRLPNAKRAAALAASSLLVSFVGLELFSRRFLPAASPVEELWPVEVTRQPRPYTMFGGRPHGALPHNRERLNSQGYRGAEPDRLKRPGERRVFVVGGSAVVLGEPPLPVLLEAELRARGVQDVRCFNYGVFSSVSGMELARIVFEVADHEPDLVVAFSGANDLTAPVQYDPRPGYPFNFVAYEHNPLLERELSSYPAFTLAAYGSNLLRALLPGFFAERFVQLAEARRRAGYGSAEWKDRIVETYVRNLVKSQRVSEAFGADFVAFFQPLVFFKRSLGPEERRIAAELAGLGGFARDLRERALAALARARREEGLQVRDLSGAFDGVAGDVFYDFVHVAAPGKQILARSLAEEIAPRLERLPGRPVAAHLGGESASDSGPAPPPALPGVGERPRFDPPPRRAYTGRSGAR